MENHREMYESLAYLADTLVSGFDVVDLTDGLVNSCLSLFDVTMVGILLDDQQGTLEVLASSSDEMQMLELLGLQRSQGPCYEAFRSGKSVGAIDLRHAGQRWPDFTPAAREQGVEIVYAIPLRLRDTTIGALNLFCDNQRGLSAEHLEAARALASMAAIGILTHRGMRRQEELAEQLQTALNSRVVIEQAKGILSERLGLGLQPAFELLRTAARRTRRPLSQVAHEVADGTLTSVLTQQTQQSPSRLKSISTPKGSPTE